MSCCKQVGVGGGEAVGSLAPAFKLQLVGVLPGAPYQHLHVLGLGYRLARIVVPDLQKVEQEVLECLCVAVHGSIMSYCSRA
jgi:hypothetical protein